MIPTSQAGGAAATFVAILLGLAAPALAAADGPDYFRVIGVKAGNVLNMRSGPGQSHSVVGSIPAGTDGVRNLGCQGGMTLEEFSKATEAEQAAARYRRWCNVEFRGTTGWAAGWHLAEGQGPAVTAAPAVEPPVLGTKWVLTSVSGTPARGDAWLTLSKDNTVNGNAGCNTFRGGARVGAGTITFDPLASTMMACTEDGVSAQESDLHAVLLGTTTFRVEGGRLTITQPAGNKTAVFEQRP
ncbi:MAG: META domain-containing protein [Rhizobiaceae bacterium]|nr:META domain-containing protein [Rhizobiaceae bacterium]